MAHWVTDGSSGFTIEGNVVTRTDESEGGSGNVFNAMWYDEEDGVSSGTHYWKIHFETLVDGGGVGLSSKEHFKEGYACRALSYSGNLSNGVALLKASFGTAPTAGDTIGILASFVDDRLKVYLDINGKSLGLAFDVPASTFKSVFPYVFFNKSGSARCHKETELPSFFVDSTEPTFSGIEGDWKIKALVEGNENPVNFPHEIESEITTKLRKDSDDEYVWFTHVVNNIITRLWREEGKWKTSHVQSTMMLGTPEAMEAERKIIELIGGLTTIDVEADGDLIIKSRGLSSVWTRYDATPGPYFGNPFKQ